MTTSTKSAPRLQAAPASGLTPRAEARPTVDESQPVPTTNAHDAETTRDPFAHEYDDGDDGWIGRTLARRFTITGKVGMGSMGSVFRATQNAMARQVAIKILRPERALDDQAKARFLREARTTSLLTSPHTVTVFDFGESDEGELYLAMELLQGESLGQRLGRVGRLSYREAVDATRQALRSLGEAHGKGIVHRDLKPDNLFYAQVHAQGEDASEILKVLDFGIAKMLHGENHKALNAVETQAGTVFGTPRYMSPEQAQGKPLDARSDLYSLGVILYHMLTGSPPFTDDDAIMVMARHIKTEPIKPSIAAPDADIPEAVEREVLRALSKDTQLRPASAEEFSQALLRALEESETAPRRTVPPASRPAPSRGWMWIAGGVAVGMSAVGLWWWSRPHEPRVLPSTQAVAPPSAVSAPSSVEAPLVSTGAAPPEPPGLDLDDPSASASGAARAGGKRPVGKSSEKGGEKSPAPKSSAPGEAKPSYGIFEN